MTENEFRFKIPFLPISVNKMYTIARRTKVMSNEARKRKNDMKWFIKKSKDFKFDPKKHVIKIEYKYVGNWFTKAGDAKVKDGPNFDKMLHDVVSECLGVDDKYFFDWHGIKEQAKDNKETTYVVISLIERENG